MSSSADANWPTGTKTEAVREIVRLAEAQLADMLTLAVAADQRAISQANMLAAVSAALLVAATTLPSIDGHDPWGVPTLLISAIGFLIAAGVSMYAARPVDFYPSGFQPKHLIECADDPDQLDRWVAEDLQDRIRANRSVLEHTAKFTTRAHRITALAIIMPVAFFGFMHLPG